jgi:hypothetical protein
MTRLFRLLCGSAAAVLALWVFSASGALGAESLFLKSKGSIVNKGTATGIFFEIGQPGDFCAAQQAGTLKTNGKPKDKSLFEPAVTPGFCEVATISGALKQIELTSTGKVIVKDKVTVALTPECSYSAKKFEKTITLPTPEITFETTAMGKRAKGSSKSCPAEATILFFAEFFDKETLSPFEAEA